MQTHAAPPLPLEPIESEAAPRRYFLVPLDGSVAAESILTQLLPLAQTTHCGLILLYVIGPPSFWETLNPTWNLYLSGEQPDQEKWARNYLAAIATRLQTTGIPIRTVISHGRPGPMIIAVTKRFPAISLLAVATHARPSFIHNFFSPVIPYLIRETAIPILIVKTRRSHWPADAPAPTYGMIAVPLDISMRTGEALAKALLLTQAVGGTLVLATFTSAHEESAQALHIAQWSKAATAPTPAASSGARDLRMRKIAIHGRLSQALLRFCRQEHPDMLVMAPQDCRHFTPRWLVGVSRRILRELAIPVLLVPPEP